MKESAWYRFVTEEWLLSVSFLGLLSTSVYLRRVPVYDASDFRTLYTLFILFAITSGLQYHHVLDNIAARLEDGNFLPLKLLLATFVFSMVVTNDVALLAIVPITLSLHVADKEWLVILEALAANAGSALSPFGNPQNLFLYWHYDIPFRQFLTAIAPFSLAYLILLSGAALALSRRTNREQPPPRASERKALSAAAYFYLGALAVFILVVVQVLPLALGALILLAILLVERGKVRADYLLLLTFVLFFGFTDNLKIILEVALRHPHHVFLLSTLLSQGISNVPAALLMADFTHHWQALLWGVSVGGFGSLIGSLANLIAYRLYRNHEGGAANNFLLKFHMASYAAFFAGWFLYLLFLDLG